MNNSSVRFIPPTTGRMVLFRPHLSDPLSKNVGLMPLSGQIAWVNDDDTVNLAVLDMWGSVHGRRDVPLIQDGQAKPDDRSFCHWMPYQIGQAERANKAEDFAAKHPTHFPAAHELRREAPGSLAGSASGHLGDASIAHAEGSGKAENNTVLGGDTAASTGTATG